MKLNDYLKQQFNSEVLNTLCTQYGVSSWRQRYEVKRQTLHVSGGYVSKITLRFTGPIMHKNYIPVISDCKAMLLFLNWPALYITAIFAIVQTKLNTFDLVCNLSTTCSLEEEKQQQKKKKKKNRDSRSAMCDLHEVKTRFK